MSNTKAAAQQLMQATAARSLVITHNGNAALRKAYHAEMEKFRGILDAMTDDHRATTISELGHLYRAAVTGDEEAAARAYDAAADAGVLN